MTLRESRCLNQSMENPTSKEYVELLTFPVELLVYIVSFLPATRDLVKLRYVSRRLRAISETPSLWREFVWPLYHTSEKRSMMNVLKVCGGYIKRLVFPDHVTSSTLMKMLAPCSNVAQLSLPPATKLDPEELRIAVLHMIHLEKLEVKLSTDIQPLFQIGGLRELTVHVVMSNKRETPPFCTSCVQQWVDRGFMPCKLNIVTHAYSEQLQATFLELWMQWNSMLPVGHTACLKLYDIYRSALNLSPVFPEAQLDFSDSATMPFVKASSFGILGLENDLVLLNDSVHNGKEAYKAEIVWYDDFEFVRDRMLNIPVTSLKFLTDFNLALCKFLHPGHLEQLAIACPNLQRLNLEANHECLKSLKGLQKVAEFCQGLRGLNLLFISFEEVEDHEELWKILSGMKKLTFLAIKICLFGVCVTPDVQYSQKLYSIFQKFSCLQGLEFQSSSELPVCLACTASRSQLKWIWLFLSYFPFLRHCKFSYGDSDSVKDVIGGCKKLKYLSCVTHQQLSLSSECSSNLEQMLISSHVTDISKIFLQTVSAHGGLIHVAISVNSVCIEGISSLIENSCELLSLVVCSRQFILDGQGLKVNLKAFKARIKKKFPFRKLFTVGSYKVAQNCEGCIYLHDYFFNSDLSSLWYV